jgi:hypothetical protein
MLATFCEAPGFFDDLVDCLGSKQAAEEANRLLQLMLLEQPLRGDVIPNAGGVRKLRWQGRDHGKRGGIRVLYQHVPEFRRFLMLAAYAKGDIEDLSPDERHALARYANDFIAMLRRSKSR